MDVRSGGNGIQLMRADEQQPFRRYGTTLSVISLNRDLFPLLLRFLATSQLGSSYLVLELAFPMKSRNTKCHFRDMLVDGKFYAYGSLCLSFGSAKVSEIYGLFHL